MKEVLQRETWSHNEMQNLLRISALVGAVAIILGVKYKVVMETTELVERSVIDGSITSNSSSADNNFFCVV